MPDPLDTLRKAQTARRRADDRYRACLLAAYHAHATEPNVYVQLAAAAGVSRQAARQAVARAGK